MQIKTDAIVINAIRYAEADLIVKMFTQQKGSVSYIIKGVLKSKRGKLRSSFFQTGSFLEIDAIHSANKNLYTLKEVKPKKHFKTLHSNIAKSCILAFLFEIINKVLIDEEPDQDLYRFLHNAFLWLDDNNEIAFFHILFLIKLTAFLGCFPDDSNSQLPEFDIESGRFVPYSKENSTISNKLLDNFRLLLGMEFDGLKTTSILKQERKDLLKVVLKYYSFHVPGYQEPKSLIVLEQLFS